LFLRTCELFVEDLDEAGQLFIIRVALSTRHCTSIQPHCSQLQIRYICTGVEV